MKAFRLVLFASALVLTGVGLSACAVDSARPSLGRTPNPSPATLGAAEPHSGAGYFLSAQAALASGDFSTAAPLFAAASAAEPSDPYVRGQAVRALILAGEVSKAAALAASGPLEGDDNSLGMSFLVRGVERLASGQPKEATLILTDPAALGPHSVAGALLAPWAYATAGDWTNALKPINANGDALLAAFSGMGRAQLLERAGKLEEAEAAYKALALGHEALFVLAYGAFLERSKRSDEAAKLYAVALTKSPGEEGLLEALARVKAKGPPPTRASLNEGAAQSLLNPAALLIADRQYEVGLEYLRLCLTLDPDRAEAWLLAGEALANLGDNQASRSAYGAVKRGNPTYGSARARLAISLEEAGDKTGALAIAKETAEALPDDPSSQVVYAELLRDTDQYDAAIQAMDHLIASEEAKSGPKAEANARLYYIRGADEERSGKWPQGEADLKHALKLEPNEAEVLNYLGFAWVDRGEHLKEGLDMLKRAAALSPDSGAIIDSLGWGKYRLKDYAGAILDLERAVQLEAGDPEINDHLGDAYWRAGRRIEATYQWRRVLTFHPDEALRVKVEKKVKDGLPPVSQMSATPSATR